MNDFADLEKKLQALEPVKVNAKLRQKCLKVLDRESTTPSSQQLPKSKLSWPLAASILFILMSWNYYEHSRVRSIVHHPQVAMPKTRFVAGNDFVLPRTVGISKPTGQYQYFTFHTEKVTRFTSER